MHPRELHGLQQRGEKLVILDARTPAEHRRSIISGSRRAPGGELALRIAAFVPEPDALETGSQCLALPAPTPDGLATVEAFAVRIAVEDGERSLTI
jgi:hypothetical protein